MAHIEAVEVEPSLLVWARETAGLSIEEAAEKLDIASEKLIQCETGVARLSFNQLRKMAGVYKRSLGIFFLPNPPETPSPITDFRGLSNKNENSYSSELRFQIRHARYRRKLALELYNELEYEPQKFELTAHLDESPEIVGRRVREWLGVTLEEQKSWKGEYDSLNNWLLVLESKFVLAFQTKEVDRDEMLGACIFFDTLPIIIVNGKYHPNSKVFTLMHELAHLCLGASGVSAQSTIDSIETEGRHSTIEKFCNYVAGEVLLPSAFLKTYIEEKSYKSIDMSSLISIAGSFGVSREVALRKLAHINAVTYSIFQNLLGEVRKSYPNNSTKTVNKNARPDYHRLVIRDNGVLFTRLVCEAYENSRISASEFSDYLDVNMKHADKIIETIGKRNFRG